MLSDKVAIVTGASRGIGRAIALALASQGAKVVASARNAEALAQLAEEIKAQGGDALAVVGDVALEDDANNLVKQAVEAYGQVDVFVNNAGITRDGLLLRMKNDDWDAVLDTNLKGAFLCTRAVAKVMSKQRSGRIINISSVVGEMGNAGQANYCASKAGLLGLTKSVARELARRNVTVNAITPGFITTEMTEDMTEKAQEAMTEQIPLGRPGSAADVANAVIFLASDQSAYITGQVLGVNGGMYM
ncbi:MAG: 3-oxoacyl-[acyl-carrier-protein] reductase [Desulfuromonadales bacterium]|jgi:3-oxoacyl-[acyl-carrier protein] reductase|nr:3-oxoacyl-[acyl-carrier-protein] reductase [Desulfuromonadales bacterium]MDH3807351.1 3-oxoacyl-[acyl-carrier-protein] reductase [Desulfuromonadales bacterium]MDH3869756.1 3-oxoacyl-[acyl-carrier-protein] reductase [Desulfuromonadales bacterium]MDH3960553.1 3-oxoacyl-[acyl-carrier-protein] reductase [Desulfuromonadales bacterium]MDH4024043.1 3-oxoacyl-[acyl-carrier-protein] reductase [Desulfuromonadales bacterium]